MDFIRSCIVLLTVIQNASFNSVHLFFLRVKAIPHYWLYIMWG